MAITNTWNVVAMDAYPTEDGEDDVIYTVHWTYTATDGNYVGSVYGTIGLTYEAGQPFTPFAQLTKEQVQGWVESAMGAEQLAAMKANVDGQIENQKNPKTETLSPPWSN